MITTDNLRLFLQGKNEPCFIYDENQLLDNLKGLRGKVNNNNIKLIYPLQFCLNPLLIVIMQNYIDFFLVASDTAIDYLRSFNVSNSKIIKISLSLSSDLNLVSLINRLPEKNRVFLESNDYQSVGDEIFDDVVYYACPILAAKPDVLIVNGGVHHLNSPLHRLFVRHHKYAFFIPMSERKAGSIREYCVYGSLCLANDCLMPKAITNLEVGRGDYFIIRDVGDINLEASNFSFIGQELPSKYLKSINNKLYNITYKGVKHYLDHFDERN